MKIALWAVQVVLALFSLAAGVNHGVRPLSEAVQTSPWIAALPPALVRFIGFAELAAALGLVLPAATRILPWLTSVAAAGLALIMCPIATHGLAVEPAFNFQFAWSSGTVAGRAAGSAGRGGHTG